MIIVNPSFSKSSAFQNAFLLNKTEKPAFSNFSDSKGSFEKLRFRDGLVCTVGLTVEMKLPFQISPVYCGSVGTVTTEICKVYTFSNIFRQILPFSVKLLFLKQTELYGMCQFTESGKTYI